MSDHGSRPYSYLCVFPAVMPVCAQVRAMACCVSTMVVTTAQQLMDANVRASAQLANLGVVLPELCFRLCQTLPGGVCAAYALQNHCKRQAEGMRAVQIAPVVFNSFAHA